MKAGHGGCEASRDGSARKTKKTKKKSPVLAQRRPRREKGLIEEVGSWLLPCGRVRYVQRARCNRDACNEKRQALLFVFFGHVRHLARFAIYPALQHARSEICCRSLAAKNKNFRQLISIQNTTGRTIERERVSGSGSLPPPIRLMPSHASIWQAATTFRRCCC